MPCPHPRREQNERSLQDAFKINTQTELVDPRQVFLCVVSKKQQQYDWLCLERQKTTEQAWLTSLTCNNEQVRVTDKELCCTRNRHYITHREEKRYSHALFSIYPTLHFFFIFKRQSFSFNRSQRTEFVPQQWAVFPSLNVEEDHLQGSYSWPIV